MRHLLFPCILLLLCRVATAQDVLRWNARAVAVHDSVYEIRLSTSIAKGWVLYADNASEAISGPRIAADSVAITEPILLKGTTRPNTDALFRGPLAVYTDSVVFTIVLPVPAGIDALPLDIESFLSDGETFLPDEQRVTVTLREAHATADPIRIASIDIAQPLHPCGGNLSPSGARSLLRVFLLGIGGGLLALLTPCLFPMIPLTVSYFAQGSGSKRQARKNGFFYGGFILLIYLLASLPFHLLDHVRPELFNQLSTNLWVNLVFFFLFVVFALSFFGLFAITLPSSFSNQAGSKGSIRNLGGIFFLAVTLAIVSFSCTGPILGSLLVASLSSTQDAWSLTAGMAGFGIALGFPFGLFAVFPQLLNALPGSGGWMHKVKVCFAFIELALAFKFLSNADLVAHWGILKREVFIGVWIVLFFCMGLYLLGAFGKRTSARKNGAMPAGLSRGRIAFALIAFAFTVYLIPGVTSLPAAHLKLLSGLAPPLSYSVYANDHLPNKGLEPDVVNDYAQAIELAKSRHKQLLIDFTGWACVNCRRMEEQVWTDPEVRRYIKDHFILVSLYVDDRKKLSQPFMYDSQLLRTTGDQWATFQSVNFQQVTQPLYAIVNEQEQLVNAPIGYTPDVDEYLRWLQCGKGE